MFPVAAWWSSPRQFPLCGNIWHWPPSVWSSRWWRNTAFQYDGFSFQTNISRSFPWSLRSSCTGTQYYCLTWNPGPLRIETYNAGHMIVHSYNLRLSGAPQIDPILAWLAGRRAFSEQHHTSQMSLQIRVYAICCFNPPSNGIHWLCVQGNLHASRPPDVLYCMGDILVIFYIIIADSRS